MLRQYLEVGRVVGTHGLRGELRVEMWCDSADFFAALKTLYWDEGKTLARVKAVRPHKNIALVTLEGVDTVEAGDLLRGRVLYLNRADVTLPEGRWFMEDLIGLEVLDVDDGKLYGTLTQIIKTGANDVYEVKDAAGKTYLVPAIPSVVVKIEPEKGRVELRPLRGIFDDAD